MTAILRCLAVLVLVCGFAVAADRTYTNAQYGFSMAYPETWAQREVNAALMAFAKPVREGQFAPNVNIVVEQLPQDASAAEVARATIQQLERLMTGMKLVSEGPLNLAGRTGHQIVFTGKLGEVNAVWWQAVVVRGNRAYYLTFTSGVDQFETEKHTAARMFGSFTLR